MINECELIEFKLIYTDKLYKEIKIVKRLRI